MRPEGEEHNNLMAGYKAAPNLVMRSGATVSHDTETGSLSEGPGLFFSPPPAQPFGLLHKSPLSRLKSKSS